MSFSSVSPEYLKRLPLKIKKLSKHAHLPVLGSPYAAGLDLCSAEHKIIPAGERALVKTDLAIACPIGTYGRVAPRSGLALKHGIDVGAGVIDADYRGPVGILLFNLGKADYEVKPGDRIAQLILEQIITPVIEEVDELDDTVRGEGGFGSTGVEAPAEKRQRTITPNPSEEKTTTNNGNTL